MGKAVASEDAFDGGDGWYGTKEELDEVISNGPWSARKSVVVEGESHHLDDLLDLERAEGF
jgi:hypothetical protein